ncbi:hypothetical protein FIBSPDRAFT_925730 [Athelia psychrophila]|uniref:PH domain-containing protein n=1 Tax=Athelia psychrophila TaxID=1759441 RepID=A0A166UA02_9AGAM|nr:hypothetical protein FIBSPDRAFT_925730 [Fibularhizoctonia sp. CBS 109695]
MASIAQQSGSGFSHFQQPLRNRTTDFTFGDRLRRLSSQQRPRSGKERENVSLAASTNSLASMNGSFITSHTRQPTSRPSSAESSSRPKKPRSSILIQASDALTSTFGRRRKHAPLPPGPIILPGVMEISASRRDDELEERDRLRDAAAQSLGLGPDIPDPPPRGYSIDSVDEDEEYAEDDEGFEMVEHPFIPTRSIRSGSVSSKLGHTPSISSRQRAGSYVPSLTHIKTHSTPLVLTTPSFPSTPSMLKASTLLAASIPKYHAPSSLLVYALSKQWKSRYIILSSPPTSSRIQAPPSYLHVFKSAGPEERELERMEINEDSVVFVADEEAGVRKGVVKVGGVEIGVASKELDDGRAMWLFQIMDPLEAQKWITAIKSAILGQRSMRAGLGLPAHSPTGNEPRGDMDVMLTMRAQGIYSSPTPRRGILPEFSSGRGTPSIVDVPETSRSSPLSMQSHTTTIKSQSSGTVSTIKGLFSGTNRTRSPSRATQNGQDTTSIDGSFGAMGSSLMGLDLHNDAAKLSTPRALTTPTITSQRIISLSSITPSGELVEQHRQPDSPNVTWADSSLVSADGGDHETPLTTPLQPPPHRRLSVVQEPKLSNGEAVYQHAHANDSVADNFGVERSSPQETLPSLPLPSSIRSRTASKSSESSDAVATVEHSVSTVASVDSEQRRGSRPVVPHRSTPPIGPRPAPSIRDRSSSEDRRTSWLQIHHPYAADRSHSPTSSTNSPITSAVSVMVNSPKRESNSSVSTASTSQSRFSMSRRGGSQRRSIPPPAHPAPNSALPATPIEPSSPSTETPRPSKTSFRNSVAQRAIRMSLSVPKPPPSSSLPPRPDEKTSRHRRSISNNSILPSTDVHSTPAALSVPVALSTSAKPVPSPPASPASPSRHTSLKQRLRILSAPSSTPSIRSLTTSIQQNLRSATPPITHMDPWVSQPSTPIAEHITSDPNLLYFPESEFRAPSPELPPPSPEIFPGSPEIMSLSPPPRRGARQASILERQRISQVIADTLEPVKENGPTHSSSHSVASLVASG